MHWRLYGGGVITFTVLDPWALRTQAYQQQFEQLVYYPVLLFPRMLYKWTPNSDVRLTAVPEDQSTIATIRDGAPPTLYTSGG